MLITQCHDYIYVHCFATFTMQYKFWCYWLRCLAFSAGYCVQHVWPHEAIRKHYFTGIINLWSKMTLIGCIYFMLYRESHLSNGKSRNYCMDQIYPCKLTSMYMRLCTYYTYAFHAIASCMWYMNKLETLNAHHSNECGSLPCYLQVVISAGQVKC